MKKINIKVRLNNKAWLTLFIAAIVSFVYTVLGLFGVVPQISQSDVMNFVGTVLTLLTTIGVLVDPTTSGLKDSDTAMLYGTLDTDAPVEPEEVEIAKTAAAEESEKNA